MGCFTSLANCERPARGDEAERRGLETLDAEAKTESERMAKAWRHLARSYEFVESLERFLLDGRTAKSLLPLHCPKCSRNMRLLGIEDGNTGELFTFECTSCEYFEAMGVPAE
jgi:ribosomal protein L44E